MFPTRIKGALTIAFLILISTASPSFSAGRTNQPPSNTVLNGKGAPVAKIGINGDFYIDLLTYNIYGPKANNKWPTPVSLRGPSGANGVDGKPGDKGVSTSGSSGARGEQGPQGEKGEKGDVGPQGPKGDTGLTGPTGAVGLQGAKGDTGAVGLTGATGAKGETGATGAQGLKGDTGLQGLKGDTGLQGVKGDTGSTGATGATGVKGDAGANGATGATGPEGPQGIQGPKGDTGAQGLQGIQGTKGDTGATGSTGATGATGPSNSYTGDISFSNTLQGNAGVSITSGNFGTFAAGKSYVVRLQLWGKTTVNNVNLNLVVSAIGATPTIATYWTSAPVSTYRSNVNSKEYDMTADVVINGSAVVTSFQLAVTITTGYSINSSDALTFSGGYTSTLSGAVSGI